MILELLVLLLSSCILTINCKIANSRTIKGRWNIVKQMEHLMVDRSGFMSPARTESGMNLNVICAVINFYQFLVVPKILILGKVKVSC